MSNIDPMQQIKAMQAQNKKLLDEQIASLKNTGAIVEQSKATYRELQNLNKQLKAINSGDVFQKAGQVAKEAPKKGLLKKLFKG